TTACGDGSRRFSASGPPGVRPSCSSSTKTPGPDRLWPGGSWRSARNPRHVRDTRFRPRQQLGSRSGGLAGRDASGAHLLRGAGVAVVALAVWGMARALAPDRERATLAVLSAICVLLWPTGLGQITVIAAAALVGLRLLPGASAPATTPRQMPVGRRLGATML